MADVRNYSARTVFEGLKNTFHQYLEAQYHIWDEDLIEERRRLLNSQGVTFQEPRLEATPFYTSGKEYKDLSIPQPAKDILTLASSRPDIGIYREPYSHQASALVEFLGRRGNKLLRPAPVQERQSAFLCRFSARWRSNRQSVRIHG